jgi:hypothetical protein
MPLILIKIIVPIFVSRMERPLVIFAHFYAPSLIVCTLIAIFIYFDSYLQSNPILFYGLLIILLGLNDGLLYFQFVARGTFLAYISDTEVGSTYYTLLASLSNLSVYGSSSLVLYTASWLPNKYAYFIEVGICVLLGCVWLSVSWRLIYQLEALPVKSWHLTLDKQKNNEDHERYHPTTTTENRKPELPIVVGDWHLLSWL